MQQYREASPERSQLLRILTHVLFGLEAIDEELVFKCSEKIYEEEPALVLRCFVDDKGVRHYPLFAASFFDSIDHREEPTFDFDGVDRLRELYG